MESTKEELRRTIAYNVRSLMGAHRVTQGQLAKAIGKSQPAVSRRLSGDYPFDSDELVDVAELFGVTPLRFLDPIDLRDGSGTAPQNWKFPNPMLPELASGDSERESASDSSGLSGAGELQPA